MRASFVWQQECDLVTDTFQERDRARLLEMITRHEGATSARLAANWLTQQPQQVLVIRDREQQPVGFVMAVALHEADPEALNADPATHVAWNYLQHHAPLREGEGALLYRFWMADSTYQATSPTQSLIFIKALQQLRYSPGMAFTFITCAQPALWSSLFAYGDFAHLSEADFELEGRFYGVYGHDCRVVSPVAWQELLVDREVATSTQETARSQPVEPPVVLVSRSLSKRFRMPCAVLPAPMHCTKIPCCDRRSSWNNPPPATIPNGSPPCIAGVGETGHGIPASLTPG